MRKQIHVDQLIPGVFLVGVDQSWLKTPFLFHKRLIRGEEDIEKIRKAGITRVTIDPEKGKDCASDAKPSESPPPASADSAKEPVVIPLGNPSVEEAEQPGTVEVIPTEEEQPPAEAQAPEIDSAPESPPTQSSGNAAFDALNNEITNAQSVRDEPIRTAQSVLNGVGTGARIDDARVQAAVHDVMDSVLRCPEASLFLVQMRQFDAELFTHVVNVCVLSVVLGKGQEMEAAQLETLATGAFLHDVGQVRLPRNIRRKTGLYTPQERKLMQKHAELGAAILRRAGIDDAICQLALEHHERPDGSGYPHGLKSDMLSTLSLIVGITDTYDAVLQGNGGFPPLLSTQALRELYQLGLTPRRSAY